MDWRAQSRQASTTTKPVRGVAVGLGYAEVSGQAADEDGDLGHLVRPGARAREGAAEVGEGLARLRLEIAWVYVSGVARLAGLTRSSDKEGLSRSP